MSPPSGSSLPTAESTSNAQASARVNSRAVVAAIEAIGCSASAEDASWDALPPAAQHDPVQDHARLARTLCALRHLTDQFGGPAFGHLLRAANEQYGQLSTGFSRPATALRVRVAAEAISICELSITSPRQYSSSRWPPGTLACLHGYASRHGLPFETAVTSLTTRLLADLRHYADHQGIDFTQPLAAGLRAHARQRLRAEGPFETGQAPGPHQESPLPVAASFYPVATAQGVVTSPADAEWLLIRTAARNQDRERHGLPAYRRDRDDQGVLAEALAEIRSQSPGDVLSGLAPQIAARGAEIEDGPAAAAVLGREHGRTGAAPYCDLEIDGDAATLLRALGETEWATGANQPYRVSLVTAYAEAYQQAAAHGATPAGSPARIAAREHPRAGQPPVPPAGTDPPGCGGPSAPPRHGPRRGA